ncbi:DUF3906 family protein [Bacillus carboniphilus]|uniref:DUF3906 family protein n=1 Tax=Bacillus carboniphilus TaxID=86663 RepID=A0ABY9JYI5_9BACI|nr:DUF3906 family protein [Bacillus carboniphilus]WLR43588.1 DUF3906 family protein [Bacillus carboniphilus]
MNIYRFEVKCEQGLVPVIIIADTDEIAFKQVDIELEKYYISVPQIDEIVLYEKKNAKKTTGFVLAASFLEG